MVYLISSQFVVAQFSPSSTYFEANLLSLFLTPPMYPGRCSLLSTSLRNDSILGSVHPRPAPGLLLLKQELNCFQTELCEKLPEYWALCVGWSKGTLLLVVINWVHGDFVLMTCNSFPIYSITAHIVGLNQHCTSKRDYFATPSG